MSTARYRSVRSASPCGVRVALVTSAACLVVSSEVRAQQPGPTAQPPATFAEDAPAGPQGSASAPASLPRQPPPSIAYRQPPPYPYAPAPSPYYPPPQARYERNSPGMMVTGIVLSSLGGLVGIATLLVAVADGATASPGDSCSSYSLTCDPGDDDDHTAAYVVAGVGSGLAIAVGIPLIVAGARRVPTSDHGDGAGVLVPSVALSPTSARLTWSF